MDRWRQQEAGGRTFQHAQVHGVVGPFWHTEHHLQAVLNLPLPLLAAREQLLWETDTVNEPRRATCSATEVFEEMKEFVKIHDLQDKNKLWSIGQRFAQRANDKTELPLNPMDARVCPAQIRTFLQFRGNQTQSEIKTKLVSTSTTEPQK